MSQFRLNLSMVIATIFLSILMLLFNEWLFTRWEFARGINWIYLPAGMQLLCTLLFGVAGTIGLLIVSWLLCFFYFFPDDFLRAFVGGLIAAAAPYIVYRTAQQYYGLRASLTNLTTKRLLICIVAFSTLNPLMHHLWFFFRGETNDIVQGLSIMIIGDLMGTLIVVYTIKLLLSFFPVARPAQNLEEMEIDH